MANFGTVKQIVGNASIVDAFGNSKTLLVGDIIRLGDIVSPNADNDELIIEINSKEITLIGKDSLKIDQSVIETESFESESSVELSSVKRAILEGQNLEDLEDTATGSSYTGNQSASLVYGDDFIEGGHESNVFEGYGALGVSGYELSQITNYTGNETIDTSAAAAVASATAPSAQNIAIITPATDDVSSDSVVSTLSNPDTAIADNTPLVFNEPVSSDSTVPVSSEPATPVAPNTPIDDITSSTTPVEHTDAIDQDPALLEPDVDLKPESEQPQDELEPDPIVSQPESPQAQPEPEINLSVKVQSLTVGDIAYGSNAAFSGGSGSGVFGLNGSYWLQNISQNGFDDLISYAVRPGGSKQQMDYITNDDLQAALDLVGTRTADANFRATEISYGDQDTQKNSDTNISLETNSKDADGNLARFLRQDGKTIEYTDDGRFGVNGSSYAAGAFGLIELNGFIYLESGKSYDFKFISDDGVRLAIDDQKVEFTEVRNATTGEIPTNSSVLLSHGLEETVTNIFSYHGTVEYNGESGLVPINIKYYDINGRSDLRLYAKESSMEDFHIVGTKESEMYLFSTDQIKIDPDTGNIIKDDTTSVIYGKAENIADGEEIDVVINDTLEMKAVVKNGAYELKFDGNVDSVVVKYKDKETQADDSDIVKTKMPEVNVQIVDSKLDNVNVEVAKAELSDTGYALEELINISKSKSSAANELINNPLGKEILTGLNAKYYVTDKDFYAIDEAKDYINENPDSYNATFDAYMLNNFTRIGVAANIASESSLLVDANTQGTFLRPWAQIGSTMPSGNVKFADGDNVDVGKSGIVQYDGYVYLEAGKEYKFKTAVAGAQEIKINGEDIFHKVENSQTGEESYNVGIIRDRIIVETKNDGSLEAGTVRYGDIGESRGSQVVKHDGTSKSVSVSEDGFYKFEATYLSSDKASVSRFSVYSVDENGNSKVVGDTHNGGLLIVKDYYEKGEDGKFYKAQSEYETTVSGIAENANDGDKVEIYHNGELLGEAEVSDGKYSFTSYFKDKPSTDMENFEVKYTQEIKKFSLDMLNIDDNSLGIKTLVAPIDGEGGYTIASLSDGATLDLSTVGNLDEAMKDVEKIELGDNAKLENLSTQDMLDLSDKQEGTVLKIDGESTSSVTLASELSQDAVASADSSEYTKYDVSIDNGGIVSIKVENEIHTDFN